MLNTVILTLILLVACCVSVILYVKNKPSEGTIIKSSEAVSLILRYNQIRNGNLSASEKMDALNQFSMAAENFEENLKVSVEGEGNITNISEYRDRVEIKGRIAKG